jgi:substrate-binding family protein
VRQDRFSEFRRWVTDAPGAERLLAAVGAMVVLGLIGWAAVPSSTDASPLGGTETVASSLDVAPDAPAAVTSGGPVASKGGTATTAHPSVSAAGATAAPGQIVAAAKRPGGALEALRASDRGVTASTVKVGFVMMDVGGLRNSGFGVINTREDIPQVIDALVDWANKKGGIHGRKIVPVKKTVDLINPSSQRNACLDYTQRDKVFAVIDSFTYVFPATRACFTVENKTPYFGAFPGGTQELAKAAPFQVSTSGDSNTMMKNWVFGAKAAGFFDKKNGFGKLGLLTDNCDRSVYDAPNGLKAYLKQVGITEYSEFVSGCDITDQQAAGVPAVLRHRRDGVTHVMLASFSTAAAGYTKAAASQSGWKPKYFESDFGFMSWDGSTPDFNPDQWDRVRAVTSTRTGELAVGKPLSPMAQMCSKILVDHGLPPIKEYNRDYEAWLHCDHLRLLMQAANIAPRNLTRLDWGNALQRVGDFDSAFFNGVRYEPGVFAGGGRKLAMIEWRKECGCYHQIKGWGKAYR